MGVNDLQLTFWQDMPSIHQSAHIRALASICERVTVVGRRGLTIDRCRQGWREPDFGRARGLRVSTERQISDVISSMPAKTVHVISGFRGPDFVAETIDILNKHGRTWGVMAEGCDGSGVRGAARRLTYWLLSIGRKERAAFVLAMGKAGCQWYQDAGFPIGKVFPYGYFTETFQVSELPLQQSLFRILYLGSLIPRKGVDILICALALLRMNHWHCEIVGDGPELSNLKGLIETHGLGGRVSLTPFVPNEIAQWKIAAADLLVLPSRFDGWGAAVNEALLLGTPVLCSDACGSHDLVSEVWRGSVFLAGSVSDLAQKLAERMVDGPVGREMRDRIRRWSAQSICGEAAAEYFLQVLKCSLQCGSRPIPPWYRTDVGKTGPARLEATELEISAPAKS